MVIFSVTFQSTLLDVEIQMHHYVNKESIRQKIKLTKTQYENSVVPISSKDVSLHNDRIRKTANNT